MALEKLKPYTSTFASVAKELDISATSVMEIFNKHVQIERKKLTSIMCWDEFYFNRHSKYKYSFIIMDFQKKIYYRYFGITQNHHVGRVLLFHS